MNAEECRNMSKSYWELTEEQVKRYESIEHTPYHTPINISAELTDIINRNILAACLSGKTKVDVDLFNRTNFQGWQIRDMLPYLRWYYKKDGFGFAMNDCEVTIDWTSKEDKQ